MIKITVDVTALQEAIKDLDRQTRQATATALTRTAINARRAIVDEMQSVFDRPTPWTLNSLKVRPATRDNLVAEVGFKEFGGTPPSKYLSPQILSGERELKRMEVLLNNVGILPTGMFIAPGQGADLDQYGNISTGQIVKILSYFSALRDSLQNMNKRRKSFGARRDDQYFVGGTGAALHLKPGIYRRYTDGRVLPVLMFVKSPHYNLMDSLILEIL